MLRFEPHYITVPWGGRRLAEELGRKLPPGKVGESWELVELPDRESVVADGSRKGEKLGELWRNGVLGGSAAGRFPFLLKWLDTHDALSVQVHPDEAACKRLGKGSPKTEAWFVAHSEPNAMMHLGHYPGLDAATLEQASKGGTVAKWLYECSPRAGEMILVPAGTLHAIGKGFMLLEVQQPSDTTFRVYDWDRPGLDGEPRELHVEEACLSVDYERAGPPKSNRREVVGPTFIMRTLATGAILPAGPLRLFVADTGGAKFDTEQGELILEYGDVVVAEPSDGSIELLAGAAVLLSEPDLTGEP